LVYDQSPSALPESKLKSSISWNQRLKVLVGQAHFAALGGNPETIRGAEVRVDLACPLVYFARLRDFDLLPNDAVTLQRDLLDNAKRPADFLSQRDPTRLQLTRVGGRGPVGRERRPLAQDQ
jgi:hypothetical protein